MPDYSWLSQHASVLTLSEDNVARNIVKTGLVLTGLSLTLLSLYTFKTLGKLFVGSSLLILILGLVMISNGLYPMGSPMHGLYAIGIFTVINPFVSCYELKNHLHDPSYFLWSLMAGVCLMIYLWINLVGLDPDGYRGLTQRIAATINYGWIAYTAYKLHKHHIA